MELSILPSCVVLESLVLLFQIIGIGALCLTRLMPRTRWAERGRWIFVIALFGLGLAGALCGRHDSQFALFAGVTMTVLLIGMIAGGGSIPLTASKDRTTSAEAALLS
ncbi:MAG: hypothetical protein JWN86_4588 [Planctomycetota bacterium]|nr:hypothetical protein [Planctomycetota bacterium]